MRRTTQTLKIAACLCLLTACANNTVALTSTANKQKTHEANLNQKNANFNLEQQQPKPWLIKPDLAKPIKSGVSEATSGSFQLENGDLKPSIQQYALEVSETRNIPQATVIALLKQAQYNSNVARLMSPSKTRIIRSWQTYKNRFVEPVRIKAGLDFWQTHQNTLEQIELEYGVPASVIVAVIGVETIYGRYTGDFLVLDTLATLGFRYPDPDRPERSQLFRDQLADLIQLHHEGKLDAYTVKGSYAGAMGLPQFMPGSLLRYAVDGDNNGNIDLQNNVADSIASVASYLRHHGWEPGLPIFAPALLPDNPAALVKGGIDPSLSWNELQQHGAKTTTPEVQQPWQNHMLGVINLIDEPSNHIEYRVATPNFFAITHYNRSYFYATAVAELANTLQTRKPH